MSLLNGAVFPSYTCCTWRDHRIADESKPTGFRGAVVHLSSGDAYGAFTGADGNHLIRQKFVGLIFLTTVNKVFSFISRGILIAMGHSFWGQAYPKALAEWKNKRAECLLVNKPIPKIGNLVARVLWNSVKYFCKDLIQLVTLPLALSLLLCTCIAGLLFPLDARRAYTLIEEMWSVELVGTASINVHNTLNYTAFCMLPRRIAEQYNLYRAWPDYHQHTIRSQLLSLNQKLENNKSYFSEETYNKLHEKVKTMREKCKKVSPSDAYETDNDGNLKNSFKINNVNSKKSYTRRKDKNIIPVQGKLRTLSQDLDRYIRDVDKALEMNQLPPIPPTSASIIKNINDVRSYF